MTRFIAIAGILSLAACGNTTPTVNSVIADGQLFCSVATASGPIVTAIIDAVDAKAVTVTGKAAATVAGICSVIGGIPVSPPANPAQAPTTAVKV